MSSTGSEKHGTGGKRRDWYKRHFVVDTYTHEIVAVEPSKKEREMVLVMQKRAIVLSVSGKRLSFPTYAGAAF